MRTAPSCERKTMMSGNVECCTPHCVCVAIPLEATSGNSPKTPGATLPHDSAPICRLTPCCFVCYTLPVYCFPFGEPAPSTKRSSRKACCHHRSNADCIANSRGSNLPTLWVYGHLGIASSGLGPPVKPMSPQDRPTERATRCARSKFRGIVAPQRLAAPRPLQSWIIQMLLEMPQCLFSQAWALQHMTKYPMIAIGPPTLLRRPPEAIPRLAPELLRTNSENRRTNLEHNKPMAKLR